VERGGGVEPGLEALREPQRDAGRECLVGGLRRRGFFVGAPGCGFAAALAGLGAATSAGASTSAVSGAVVVVLIPMPP